MNRYNSGDIKIVEISNLDELNGLNDYDLIVSSQPFDGAKQYPENITFNVEIPPSIETYLESFESSKRSSIRKRIRNCSEGFDAKLIENLTKEQFLEWLEGYKKFISSIPFGQEKVDEEWFETGSPKHFAIFFYKDGKLEGGALIQKMEKTQKLSISYAWYNDEIRAAGASTYVVVKTMEFGYKIGYKLISFGQDKNLYGGHLSIGLHDFKTSWGETTTPIFSSKTLVKYIKPNSQTDKKMIYYTLNSDGKLEINKFNI